MPGTWFLPPDFTFTSDGPLRLGMVVSHWSRPHSVLAELGRGTADEISLPTTAAIVEQNHVHNRSKSRSSGLGVFSKFLDLVSFSASQNMGRSTNTDYSAVDHEVRFFSEPLTPETVAAIANLEAVRKHIDSGMFGVRPVYIVSGIRIAMSPVTVTTENASHSKIEIEGSGPPAGAIPVEVGGKVEHGSERTITDSYDTAAGVVFAYRLHIVRTHRADLFSHKSAFLTGESKKEQNPLILVEADKSEIDFDLEEDIEHESIEFGDEVCITRRFNDIQKLK